MDGNKLHCVFKQSDWIMPRDTRREDEKMSSSFPKDVVASSWEVCQTKHAEYEITWIPWSI